MDIKSAVFVISNQDHKKCPAPNLPEFAFIGRSNVGKSSLINMLTDRKSLAKTSSTPGKTQLINHFNINDLWYLVDLPGYGYAKLSKNIREKFGKMIQNYIITRSNLLCLFVLIDSRLAPQKKDVEFLEFLGQNEIPFAIVFTKSDKLTKNQLAKNISQYKITLKNTWEFLPEIFISSAETKLGQTEILSYIESIIPSFEM